MYTSVKELTSPGLKTFNEGVETPCYEIRSYNGHASEDGASCDSNSKPCETSSHEKKWGDCCDFLSEYKPDEAVKEHLHDESYRRGLEPADYF
ncbi:hypothetical protein Bpfe_014560 [Biomphalaria pfeifferi]|uniref:Uncharacterized protein n=1 Tax=Biomphalaria pfeifferi TaxID=112525 RepID=A0AAD8BKA2_BIOPF|nr:hypothetical protein Bpfe_014560 [Biomphalaria pfeifferi]